MSGERHSPGPWQVMPGTKFVVDADGSVVAAVGVDEDVDIIARAPDLLKADAILRELRLILTDIVARGRLDRAAAARETLRTIDGLEVLHGRKVP